MTMTRWPSASQTVGPFFNPPIKLAGFGEAFPDANPLTLTGRLLDGAGAPIGDAMIEAWQADPSGHLKMPDGRGFSSGFTRVCTDKEGRFTIHTQAPGAVEGDAPHLVVTVFARGLLRHLFTHVYLAANAHDAVQTLAGARAATMIATQQNAQTYTWDIHLQGAQETVFFDF